MWRIEVPADINLDRQAALGWMNSHLFEIRTRDVGSSLLIRLARRIALARKAKLTDVLEGVGTKILGYLYDHGGGRVVHYQGRTARARRTGHRLPMRDRGIVISYETVRRWVNHFGPIIAQAPSQTAFDLAHPDRIARRPAAARDP